MFQRWFGGRADTDSLKGEPFWVDRDWVMSYARAREKYEEFTGGDTTVQRHIVNNAALDQLAKILCREGYMTDDKPSVFDFTSLTDPTELQKKYHTQIVVPYPPSGIVEPDGLFAAMGAFSLRALARGRVEPLGGKRYRVHVDGVSVFVRDAFNFEEEGLGGNNYLGDWDCETLSVNSLPFPGSMSLENSTFRAFRSAYGQGGDFTILSEAHPVEDFPGAGYEYTCSK